MACTSPCLLATECYQNCLAESCFLHVDGHCKSSCRVVFHVKTISSTAKHHHMSFLLLLPVLHRLYYFSLPHDQFTSLVMSVCVCAHVRVCAHKCVCVHSVILQWGKTHCLHSRCSFLAKKNSCICCFVHRVFILIDNCSSDLLMLRSLDTEILISKQMSDYLPPFFPVD